MLSSSVLSHEELLATAVVKKNRYEWVAAAELYKRDAEEWGPRLSPREAASNVELMAEAYFRGAFQAKSRDEFKRRMGNAISTYERAEELYQTSGGKEESKLCTVMRLYCKHWSQDNIEDRRSLLEQGIKVARELAIDLVNGRNIAALAETHRRLLMLNYQGIFLDHEPSTRRSRIEEIIATAPVAIEEFKNIGDKNRMLECIDIRLLLSPFAAGIIGPAKETESASTLLRQIMETSKVIGTPYALVLSGQGRTNAAMINGDLLKELAALREYKHYADETQDRLLIGRNLAFSSSVERWLAAQEEDSERERAVCLAGIESARGAIENMRIPRLGAALSLAYASWMECLILLAIEVERDPETKRRHLNESLRLADLAREYEQYSEWHHVRNSLGKATYFLARMEPNIEVKTRLLEAALSLREENRRALEHLDRGPWDTGVQYNYLGLARAELSEIAVEPEARRRLLESAVADMERGVNLCSEEPSGGIVQAALARYVEQLGDLLVKLHDMKRDEESRTRAVEIFEGAIDRYVRSGRVFPIGYIRWKIAKVHNAAGDYQSASHAFRKAAEDYRLAVNKDAHSKATFVELVSYMDAWAMVEDARFFDDQDQHEFAANNYEQAAVLFQLTKTWNYLSAYYDGCSSLAQGLAQDRREEYQASIESFQNAVKSIKNSATEIEERLSQSGSPEEKEELMGWLETVGRQEKYCEARVHVGNARLFDRKGEPQRSMSEYLAASQIFRSLVVGADEERMLRELKVLTIFCDAWAKMKEAESNMSPAMYSEAASKFDEIERLSTETRERLVALSNASVCRSLESGTEFLRTRDSQLYSKIKRYLEVASDHYQQAEYKVAAKWARATGNLFDALALLVDAAIEKESNKRLDLYDRSDKHLQLAARLFGEAGFAGNREKVLKQLERVHEEKALQQVALGALSESPAEIKLPTVVAPLTGERDLGLDRFEVANVQGNLTLEAREVPVGSSFTMEVELVNMGRATATLTKLENLANDWLELAGEHETLKVEDSFVDMRGRKLEHMKTHQLKVPVRAKRLGSFEIRPRILFVDEKGQYRSNDFEPLSVVVREPWEAAVKETGAVVLQTNLVSGNKEISRDESIEASFEVRIDSQGPITLEAIENVVPNGLSALVARGGLLKGGLVDLNGVKLEPLQFYAVAVLYKPVNEGITSIAPSLSYKDAAGRRKSEAFPRTELTVYSLSPVMEFLAKAFSEDYVRKRLSIDRAGWRGLMEIAEFARIPKNQVYGDSRYGHTFGKALRNLVRTGLVEYRTFSGKGRGGSILKLRASYEKEPVKRLVDRLTIRSATKPQ